jgi:two-component system OmpR family sensor kinase
LQSALASVPLRVKLVATVLLLAAVGLGLAATATATSLHSYLIGRTDDQLRTFALGPGDHDGEPRFGPEQGPGPGGATPHELPSEFYVEHFQPNGHPDVHYYDPLTSQSPPSLPLLTTGRATELSTHAFTVSSQDGSSSWRVLAVVDQTGGGTTAFAIPLSDVNHTVDRVIWLEAGIGLVVLVFMGLAGFVLINRSLRPLVSVEHTAAAIAAGDLTQRVPELPERTEVGRLSHALNGMLTQIEDGFAHEQESKQQARASEERMRRFVADASHELRTPLTSIRGFAELYRIGGSEAEPDTVRMMHRIETEAARMGVLVDDLLLLARLDQQRPLERDPVDVLAIATDVVHDARTIAPDRAVTLTVTADVPPVVLGDEARLRQIIGNLMSNAMSHTPDGSPIAVSVATADSPSPVAIVEVADRGEGVSHDEASRIFERFYRADASRSRSAGGAGLGLSIVAGLVGAHGGTVRALPRDGGGAVFRISLPLAPAAADSHVTSQSPDSRGAASRR